MRVTFDFPPLPPIKTCGCGAAYSRATWRKLPLLCHNAIAGCEDDPDPLLLELRNCACGSTISVDLYELGQVQQPKGR